MGDDGPSADWMLTHPADIEAGSVSGGPLVDTRLEEAVPAGDPPPRCTTVALHPNTRWCLRGTGRTLSCPPSAFSSAQRVRDPARPRHEYPEVRLIPVLARGGQAAHYIRACATVPFRKMTQAQAAGVPEAGIARTRNRPSFVRGPDLRCPVHQRQGSQPQVPATAKWPVQGPPWRPAEASASCPPALSEPAPAKAGVPAQVGPNNAQIPCYR